jgi:hypothetical protein
MTGRRARYRWRVQRRHRATDANALDEARSSWDQRLAASKHLAEQHANFNSSAPRSAVHNEPSLPE